MINKKTDQRDPTSHLPEPMRQYLGLPMKLFLLWILLSGLAVALFYWGSLPQSGHAEKPTQTGTSQTPPLVPMSVPTAKQDQAPKGMPSVTVNISVSGPAGFSLRTTGNAILIGIAGAKPLELVDDEYGKHVQTQTGQLLYRIKGREDGQGKIYDASDAYRYRLKCETEDKEDTCKLYDGQGTLLNRVKVKADSYNVYAADSQRIYKGSMKNGSYVLKNEAGDAVASIQGVGGLMDAALLSFPVEIPLRALLWASR